MFDSEIDTIGVSSCQGKIFKADVQHCRTKRGVMLSVRLNEMKNMSCPGCDKCGWLDDDLGEVDLSWPIIGIEKAEHGKLYKIEMCNMTEDWETGHVDSWDLKINPCDPHVTEASTPKPSTP